ncbi:MAG TPA: hypothetical protein VEW69_04780, partial [Alphaproteobacteria bacterium]|nr:hypothetical protein [Alphaproteobacteria bacterium]
TPVTGGLPASNLGRIRLAIARGSQGKRIYALIDAKEEKDRGLYRSDDSAANWTKVSSDPRISGRGWYFGEIDVDPKNPDVVYSLNVSIYRSTDGGKNFTAIKGAPGGDDYHTLWIDPANPQRMINGSDQGVGVSVDGGNSWSSWYNQPTAQLYHVAVDNQFPYHVYGAQQDSGSVDTTSRGNDGSITFRDWHPAGAGESGYIVPDPADPNILYGGGTYGELFRYEKRTGQVEDISPNAIRTFGDISRSKLRFTWTSPLAFSSTKPSSKTPRALYFGSQFLLKSTDQGKSWQQISPDLTGSDPNVSREGPTTVENALARGYGVIYTIAPSPLDSEQIWVGTDTGLIHFTRDGGKTWSNVTPPGLKPWSKVSMIEPSHFDTETVYVALDRHRMDDTAPYFCRANRAVAFERHWDCRADGIPDGAYLRSVREDPVRQGLLFAGTELGVYFSIDDGNHWQPLQLNMPVVPVHDLVIKDNDLVVATHGRSFWILDDISPLRQLTSAVQTAPVHLFKPATAMRIRKSANTDTPLPPEVPAGENPPHGAVFYYYLKSSAQAPVTLEILDAAGNLVRRYSSADQSAPPPVSTAPFPVYWFRDMPVLSAAAGMHRFAWDLRYAQPAVAQPGFSMSTVFGQNVPTEPQGPQALPGDYQVRLTVAGQTFTQPFRLVMDPRVNATTAALQEQFTLERELSRALAEADAATQQIHSARVAGRISEDVEKMLQGTDADDATANAPPGLKQVSGTLAHLLNIVDSADTSPTSQESEAAAQTLTRLHTLIQQWETLKSR